MEDTPAGDGALETAIAEYEDDAGRITDEEVTAARARTLWQPAPPLAE